MSAFDRNVLASRSSARRVIGVGLMLFGLLAILFVAWSAWRCDHRIDPAACPTVGETLSPSLTALGFLAAVYIAWRTRRPFPVVAYFWLGSMALTVGLASGIGGRMAAVAAFDLALAWLPPVGLRYHLVLLGRPLKSGERIVFLMTLALAVAWTVPLLSYLGPMLATGDLIRGLSGPILLTLALTLLAVPTILWLGYRSGLTPAAARQIRIVAMGSSLAFAPLALLSILPVLVGSPLRVPYPTTFPFLLLSPLFYLYVYQRSQLAQLEPLIGKITVIFLLAVFTLSAYLVIGPLGARIEIPENRLLAAATVIVIVCVFLFRGLERAFTAFTSWSFEGDSLPNSVVERLTEAVSLTPDRTALQELLLERLPQTLRADPALLALRTSGQELALQYAAQWTPEERASWRIPIEGVLVSKLDSLAWPLTPPELRRMLHGEALTSAEARLLEIPPGSLLLPLFSGGNLQGILVVGGRTDDDPWRNDDFAVLTILGRQIGATIHNLLLLEAVSAGRNELARVHRQFVLSQEREQRQLAQELHDGAVQHLLGISYQLADAQRRALRRDESAPRLFEGIRAEVLAVSEQLRRLIGQLRPAGLDELGLVAALEEYVARVQRDSNAPEIQLDLDRRSAFLPEAVSICLFRTVQEGIRNAVEHAGASRIAVALQVMGDSVVLTVQDDGRGFMVPSRLSELAQADHFGLVGVAERVAWIGGKFDIRSQPSGGVLIQVSLPLVQPGGNS